ncbi:MAG: ankyrin repeat domain-containing protein [Ginsengibacter sp.]
MNIEEIIDLIKTGKNNLLEQEINDNPLFTEIKTEQGISLLQFAAYCRNSFAVDILKKKQQNFDIFEAASIGDNDKVNTLLDKNPELLNSFSTDGFTPLGLASFFGHLSLVKLLLRRGANPNIASNNQFKVAPIHSACAISHLGIVELLLEHDADVNAKQMNGVTPLHSTCHNGQTKLSKILLENGAEINAKMDNGQTPLFMAQEKGFQETADLIKNHGGY